MHVGLGRQLKGLKLFWQRKMCQLTALLPVLSTSPEENFPGVILLATLGVRKCHGCKGK